MHIGEPEDLIFRSRSTARPCRRQPQSSSVGWWVLALVSAIGFFLVIRALLDRTAWTAGPAPRQSPAVVSEQPSRPAAFIAPAPVPMVYRCVDRAGAVSLQSQPCGPDQRTTRAVPAPPDVEPVRQRLPARPTKSPSAVYYYAGPSEAEQRRAQVEARCGIARREREQTLQRIGLRRTYDLLQQLDAMVTAACKGT